MRQVPHYLIIGNGRVATHIKQYFSLLSLSYSTWHRSESYSLLNEVLTRATHVLLLISDRAIETFIDEHLHAFRGKRIHFSGALVTDKAYGLHPLMTFSDQLYNLEKYQSIPFVIDHDAPSFETLLPGLSNQHARLDKSLKEKYHAMCVLSGNFSCLLWQKFFNALENEFTLPASLSHYYLKQQTENLMMTPETAFTGPLVRGDQVTIEKNIAALENDAFQAVYKSFLTCYEKMKRES